MTAWPILYSFRRCPYAMRARMALLASGQKFEWREISLKNKPASMLEISPKATVPVLQLPSGRVIDQSLEIMHWALQQSDPFHWLDWIDEDLITANDGVFKYHLDRAKYFTRYSSDPEVHKDAAVAWLQPLERRLEQSLHLCGDAVGMTDIALFPFIRQFSLIDAAWFSSLRLFNLDRWLGFHMGSAVFTAAMVRHVEWRSGAEGVYSC